MGRKKKGGLKSLKNKKAVADYCNSLVQLALNVTDLGYKIAVIILLIIQLF